MPAIFTGFWLDLSRGDCKTWVRWVLILGSLGLNEQSEYEYANPFYLPFHFHLSSYIHSGLRPKIYPPSLANRSPLRDLNPRTHFAILIFCICVSARSNSSIMNTTTRCDKTIKYEHLETRYKLWRYAEGQSKGILCKRCGKLRECIFSRAILDRSLWLVGMLLLQKQLSYRVFNAHDHY